MTFQRLQKKLSYAKPLVLLRQFLHRMHIATTAIAIFPIKNGAVALRRREQQQQKVLLLLQLFVRSSTFTTMKKTERKREHVPKGNLYVATADAHYPRNTQRNCTHAIIIVFSRGTNTSFFIFVLQLCCKAQKTRPATTNYCCAAASTAAGTDTSFMMQKPSYTK